MKKRFRRNRLVKILGDTEERCKECGQGPEWNGKPLVLPVDHIDGDCTNNAKSNLRYVCPNCHTQTETWGTKRLRERFALVCKICEETFYVQKRKRSQKFCSKKCAVKKYSLGVG